LLVPVLLCCLPFICLWWQIRKYHRQKEQALSALTPENDVDVNDTHPHKFDPKPHHKINFVGKHWLGEYSLPRSYWLHGVFFGTLIGLGGAFLTAALKDAEGTGSPYVFSLAITCIVYALCWLVFYIWVTGGSWRSATRRGGFWARMAKVALVLGWLGVVSQTVQEETAVVKT
jgi:hypothetical protein